MVFLDLSQISMFCNWLYIQEYRGRDESVGKPSSTGDSQLQGESLFLGKPESKVDSEDLNVFFCSAFELLEKLEESILLYEARGDSETLNTIFRTVHTIKGDADYLGLKDLAGFSHSLESLLEQLRNHSIQGSREIVDILL